MKKRVLAFIFAAALMVTGCGSSTSSTTSSAPAASAASSTAASSSAESTAQAASTDTDATTETAAASSSGGLLASIKSAGKLVVGTASGYPPYEFVDTSSADNKIVGVDLELAQAIADDLGVTLEIQDMDFSGLLASIPAGKIDLAIAGVSPTDERKQTMDFSENYLEADQKFLILKKNADSYKTLDDFKGKPLAVEKATTQEALVQKLFPDNQLVSLEKVPDCIMELKQGNVAGVCVENIVGEQYLLADDSLAFSDADTGAKKQSAVVLAKGNEDLIEEINKVIDEHKANGDFDKWVEEYSKLAADNAAK
jgi:ABC-type amino acid transport substrate-binding protein